MGEYAHTLSGEHIKIGTCEDLYNLRYEQRRLVGPPYEHTDPTAEVYDVRFRFPFPDEDDVPPGGFDDHNRGVEIPGYEPADYMVENCGCAPGAPVEVIQQRLVKDDEGGPDELQTVVRVTDGSHGGSAFRLSHVEALVVMLKLTEWAQAVIEDDPDRSTFLLDIASRVGRGYPQISGAEAR